MRTFSHVFAVTCISLCTLVGVRAQDPLGQRPRMPEMAGLTFIEALTMPGPDSAFSRVDILYRIDREFFVPVRRKSTSSGSPFERRGEVLMELFDSSEVSRAREIDRVELGDGGSPPLAFEKKWYQGLVSFSVAPGTYRLLFEATDLESQRKYLNDRMSVRVRRFPGTTLQAGDVCFVDAQTLGDTLTPENLGGDLHFGSRRAALVFLRGLDTAATTSVSYSLFIAESRREDSTLFHREDSSVFDLHHGWTYTAGRAGILPVYFRSAAQRPTDGVLLLPLKAEMLPLRPFQLRVWIHNGPRETTLQKAFRTVWPEMPLSLKDVDKALDVLKYVTTESQLDSLRGGSFEDRIKNLEGFWKSKDQTPETAYNEVMTEYYRRVDYATREYATLRQPDGWRSDRGRTYILHGPPTTVERTLDPVAGFREVWVYDRPMKQFTFIDRTKNGEYLLLQGSRQ